MSLLLIGSAAFAAAFVSGFAGFGGSFILAIALTTAVGPKAVVPIIAVYATFANLSRVYIYRNDVNWAFAIQFITASMPGLAIGALFLKWVPETVLLAVFGVVLLGVIPLRRYLKNANFAPTWQTTAVIGFVFGVVSGTAVGSGMFVIAALNSFGLYSAMLLGTDAVIGIVNAVSRVVTFTWLGLLTWPHFLAGLLTGLVSLPATWLASLLVKKVGQKLHTTIIEVVIALAGLSFLVSAINRLWL